MSLSPWPPVVDELLEPPPFKSPFKKSVPPPPFVSPSPPPPPMTMPPPLPPRPGRTWQI